MGSLKWVCQQDATGESKEDISTGRDGFIFFGRVLRWFIIEIHLLECRLLEDEKRFA
jgi:hypothetical protein